MRQRSTFNVPTFNSDLAWHRNATLNRVRACGSGMRHRTIPAVRHHLSRTGDGCALPAL